MALDKQEILTIQNRSPRITVAMLGARMHYAVPRLIHQAGMLEQFFTDSYVGNKPWLKAILEAIPLQLRPAIIRRWLGRADIRLSAEKVESFDWLGIRFVLALRRARTDAARESIFVATGKSFARAIIRRGLGEADTVWGFNTAALELFQAARSQGLTCVLEQTILPYRLERRLLDEVAADWPGWQPEFQAGSGGGVLAAREEAEWALADRIIVGSDFVARGLVDCGVSPDKIVVIPYGVDTEKFAPPPDRVPRKGPLRVLFVGEVGLRKGAPYLLEALRRLGPELVEARFAGRVALDPARLAPYTEVARFLGAVPRSEIFAQFHWADVFVLPSIVEGSAVATYEALASGLPIIATPNTGSIVENGYDGQIVATRDIGALTSALEVYARDPLLLERHAANAVCARTKGSIERYGRDIVRCLAGEG